MNNNYEKVTGVCVPYIEGIDEACMGKTMAYRVPSVLNTGFTWSVSSNGSIQSGQGTAEVQVKWNNGVAGTLSVHQDLP